MGPSLLLCRVQMPSNFSAPAMAAVISSISPSITATGAG
jgi:hypothetical protein